MRSVLLTALAFLGACTAPMSLRPEPLVGYAPGSAGQQWVSMTQEIAAKLDADCPLDAPVLIIIRDVPGKWGQSYYSPLEQRYVIELSPGGGQIEPFFRDSIIHEWAHCMTHCLCIKAHCEHWGANYAQCYRLVCDDS